MKKTLLSTALSSILLVTAACQSENPEEKSSTSPETGMADLAENVVATVNGQEISQQALNFLQAEAAQRSRGMAIPRAQLIDELVSRELLAQEARSKDLESRPDIAQQMKAMDRAVLSQAAVEEFLRTDEVSDEEMKVEYDARIGDTAKTEYKARHILLKTAEEAQDVISKLDDGGDFAELAKEFSTGPTGANGGDLGWFGPDQMVGPFTDAVVKLENGAYTKEPVPTQFGFHVILREESRDKTPPPFEAVKPQLMPLVQRQHLQSYLEKLRRDADVVVKPAPEPAASEQEAPASPHDHDHAAEAEPEADTE